MTTYSIMARQLAEALESIDVIERLIADTRRNLTDDPASKYNLQSWNDQLNKLRANAMTLRDRINNYESQPIWNS